jgi:cell wall-associated NlpC family hydrolase
MRASIAQIAATAYEEGNLTSPAALLTSGDPQQILNQSSILLELSANNNAAMNQFLAAARQLTGAQQAARRVEAGMVTLKNNLSKRKQSLDKLRAQQEALLAQLTPAQQAAASPGGSASSGSTGSTGSTQYKGSTSTQAGKAVAFAYAQIGKPYAWGATGPGSFDCSGLTMASWAAAGVSIPRISYDQMSQLPAVSLSALEPGDILGFAGNSHVGIYVGGGYAIDAPQTGQDVQKVALSGWYKSELDGAVRP